MDEQVTRYVSCHELGISDIISVKSSESASSASAPLNEAYHRAVLWTNHICSLNSVSPLLLGEAQACLAAISALPENTELDGFGSEVSLDCARALSLLGTDWLSDEVMNAGLALLSQRLIADTRIFLTTTYFLSSLSRYHQRAQAKYMPAKAEVRRNDRQHIRFKTHQIQMTCVR